MSVQLSFTVCSSANCDQLIFTETTGAYSGTNLTGWNAPNVLAANAETATLTVTSPDLTVTVINLFTEVPAWPSTDTTQEFIITPSMIGATTTKFSDGVYTFLYTVTRTTATAFSYTQTVQQLFYCNAKCCVTTLFANIDDWECDCNKVKINEAYQADILLRALQRASKCGNTTSFTKTLTLINNLCSTTSTCTSCG